MQQGVNIEQVRQYNQSLKQYRDKAAEVKAKIDFNKAELARLCQELSNELGIEVTPENVAQVRDEQIAKIENTLSVGNEILNRIRSEEAAGFGGTPQPAQMPVSTQPVMQVPAQGQIIPPPINMSGATQEFSGFASVGDIPPLFNMNS